MKTVSGSAAIEFRSRSFTIKAPYE